MWLNVELVGVLVTAGVALGDGVGGVGVLLGGRSVGVAPGVRDGVAVGVDGVGVGVGGMQAAVIIIAKSKITGAIDR